MGRLCRMIAVGMPVTRHPPCSPGRAVCPHPVPRLYSRPRGTAKPSRLHAPVLALREARPGYSSPVQALGELRPGNTLPLPTAPMAPCKRTAHSALEQAVQGAVVAWHTVVVVVAPQPTVQPPVELASRQVPVLFDPFRYPSTRRLELLARGASFDTRHALAIWHPIPLESQTREAPPQAGMETTDAQEVGVVGGDLEVEWLQPVGSHPIQPFRIILVPEGADPVIGVAAQPCLAATVRLHDLGTPHIQGVVHLHMGQDG